ncbi:hypothetical protein, partial [Vibrio mediterranei]|uniref:hypothetical protein n=1 Tax=Vibrio mediterranei TaxID=689 RepID=UPI001EFD0CDA
ASHEKTTVGTLDAAPWSCWSALGGYHKKCSRRDDKKGVPLSLGAKLTDAALKKDVSIYSVLSISVIF